MVEGLPTASGCLRPFTIPAAIPRHRLPAWLGHYVGLPFVDLGRTRDGADCWGLVRLVLAERFKIQAPAWDNRYPGCAMGQLRPMARHVNAVLPLFEPVSTPVDGDVVLVKVGGLPVHVGIVVAPGWMAHTEYGVGSACETILAPNRTIDAIDGFYRWRGTADG